VRSGLSALLDKLDLLGQRLENFALVFMLGGMIVLAVGQIVLRELFETGFVWVDELLKLMVLWLAMVGSIAACRDDRYRRVVAPPSGQPGQGDARTC
jgi:TRAP-type C4-dicarboxylate transport system permease small subunit